MSFDGVPCMDGREVRAGAYATADGSHTKERDSETVVRAKTGRKGDLEDKVPFFSRMINLTLFRCQARFENGGESKITMQCNSRGTCRSCIR